MDVVELKNEDFHRYISDEHGDRGWEWPGPELPEGFDIGLVDQYACSAAQHCYSKHPAPIGFTLTEGDDGHEYVSWQVCFMINERWVVCEDCMIGLDTEELVIRDGQIVTSDKDVTR